MKNAEKKINAKDWKLWVFTVIPVVVFVVALILSVVRECQVDKGNYVPALEVASYVLVTVALEAFLVGAVLKLFNNGGKRNTAAAIILIVLALAVCAVLIICTVTAPTKMRLEIAYNNAYSEWKNVSVNDESYDTKNEAYSEAKDNFEAVFRPIDRMMTIAQAVLLVGVLAVYLIAKAPKSINEQVSKSKPSDTSDSN